MRTSSTRLTLVLSLLLLLERLASGCEDKVLPRSCQSLCTMDPISGEVKSCELRVAVILPSDSRYEISQAKVSPVLGQGIKLIKKKKIFNISSCSVTMI